MKIAELFTLENGLKCVHIADNSDVELSGVFINAGSRNDPASCPGVAHFVEHTVFKGTARRSSWHINNRMESVGGEINAFTSKEETIIYAVAPRGNCGRAVELIADLVANASFPTREIEIERGVVIDEIDSYLDSPADSVFDDFEDSLFAGSSLGHNILGTKESVRAITTSDCKEFIASNYTPSNMVFFYAGPATRANLHRHVDRWLGSIARPDTTPLRNDYHANERFDLTKSIESHQANTVMGAAIDGRFSPLRPAYLLLANILGGPGMNALLNLELRERRGLVYSVDASTTFYTDCGMFAIAFGCDPDNEARCRSIVSDVLTSKLPSHLNERRLEAAKRQFLGQMRLRNDYRDSFSFNAARSLFYYGAAAVGAANFEDSIKRVTLDELRHIANRVIAPDSLSILTLR